MEISSVPYSEINCGDLTLKPTFHLNYGKRKIASFIKAGGKVTNLGSDVDDIHRPGIFKRVFIENESAGIPYISAQHMMCSSPLDRAKLISKKYTPQIDHMTLNDNEILVSCAGTVGNVRLITKDFSGIIGSQDIIRVVSHKSELYGFIYAYLSSPTAYSYIQSYIYGSVVPRLDPKTLSKLPIPIFLKNKKEFIHNLIVDSAELRVKANHLLTLADNKIHEYTDLEYLKNKDYEFFGAHSSNREVSTFICAVKGISSTTINSFNYSKKIDSLKKRLHKRSEITLLVDILNDKKLFKTGSFPRKELRSDKAIQLVNQSDIFDIVINGKMISRRNVKTDNLVSYGEVLIAGVGTLGENETFCRVVYANKDLEGQLVSGEFIRMITNEEVPSGYLFAWLNSDYGFRFLRSTQAGTKLCRPIPSLLEKLPVPILDASKMLEIHNLVDEAHKKRHEANEKEKLAIKMIEEEIDSWQ